MSAGVAGQRGGRRSADRGGRRSSGRGGGTWDGSWVTSRLGVRLQAGESGRRFADLAGLAVRCNPNRAHLVVSRVLGKHVPVDPPVAVLAGRALGARVASALPVRVGSARSGAEVHVLGYAETATALGHLVADSLDHARYLHSTRRTSTGVMPLGGFDEAHSHARAHLLVPADAAWFDDDAPVVIVDDELTTGRTVLGSIRQLQAIHPRRSYLVAALLDLRSAADRAAMAQTAADLGVSIEVVSLATAELTAPADVLDRGRMLVADLDRPDPVPLARPAGVSRIDVPWPAAVPHGGRHGFLPDHRAPFAEAIGQIAALVSEGLIAQPPPRGGDREAGAVLVLGTEELMYAPMMLAEHLARRWPAPVRFSSTTRSPVLPVGVDGYAVRTRLCFPSHDTPTDCTERFAYNVAPVLPGDRYHRVVVVVDQAGDTPRLWGAAGLVERLRRVCGGVLVAVLPAEVPGGVR